MDFNLYLGLGINGFCTGLGVIFANIISEQYIKPRLKKLHKKLIRRHRLR
jgi:hypothetical protein